RDDAHAGERCRSRSVGDARRNGSGAGVRQIAVADVGGTHARFALADIDGGRVVSLGEPVTLKTAEHGSFQLAWQEFGRRAGIDLPNELAIAFAGPVGGEVLKLTNNPWVIRPALIKERLGVDRYVIVNDFGAVAYAVATLPDEDFRHVCGPERSLPKEGVTSIVGPGTGLGVAALLRKTDHYEVIETEGGHIDFAPLDSLEDKILMHLRRDCRRRRFPACRLFAALRLPRSLHRQGPLRTAHGRNAGQADHPSAAGPVRRRCSLRKGTRMNIDAIMRSAPVIPVLILEEEMDWAALAETLVAAGLPVLEVTLRTPVALEAIRQMSNVPGAIPGAGTVLNEAQLAQALDAGSQFIVSP